jgi:hypothetical protein
MPKSKHKLSLGGKGAKSVTKEVNGLLESCHRAKGAKGVTEELKELLESCHGERRC